MSSGGKREGAGRPRKNNIVSLHVRVPIEVAEEVRAMAKVEKKPIGDVIVDCIKNNKREQ